MTNAEEDWLTTQGAMQRLGVSRTRLWMLVNEGRLTPHQRGTNRKVRYYRLSEVEQVARDFRPVPRGSRSQDEAKQVK